MTEKRKIGEGASDHTDERTEIFPSELSAEILTAHCRETTNWSSHQREQRCLYAASSNRKAGDLLSCLPMGAHAHPSHLRMKGFLAELPTSGGTGQRKQTGKKKQQGRLPVLTDCHHRCSVHQDQLAARRRGVHTAACCLRCPHRYSKAASK